jgi:hypothetical protein
MHRSLFVLSALVGLSSITSCHSDDGASPRANGPGAITEAVDVPCEVATILRDNCLACHSSPPAYGAPMPLVTWDQLHADAPSDPSRKVFEMMGERTHAEGEKRMPKGGRLSDADQAALDAWIDAGAPRLSGPTCAKAEGDGPTVQSLPCTPSHAFHAHLADGDGRFPVGKDVGNLNMCFAYRVPWEKGTEAIAFGPKIDDKRVIHHWILFSTATQMVDGSVFPCDQGMPTDLKFLNGWAPGAQARVMADDLSMELPGPDEFLILQVHYWNVAGYEDASDASGVELCTTTEPRAHTMSVSTLGTLNIDVPAHGTATTSGTCTPDITEDVTIVSSGPHMHRKGVSIKTEIFRGGDPDKMETLVSVDPWNFDNQVGKNTPTVIHPGDKLRTTCSYANETDRPITFGEKTENEMCFNFISAYPAGALAGPSTLAKTRRLCVDAD